MRSRLLAMTLAAYPAIAFAGSGLLGTKVGGGSSFDTTPASPVGVGSVVQLSIALGVVLLLVRFVLPKVITKMNRRLVTNTTGGIRIEESASFAGGNLYVIHARRKTLLVSVATTGVTCLADLTDAPGESEQLPSFREVLSATPGQFAPIVEDSSDPLEAALARLDRLDRMTKP